MAAPEPAPVAAPEPAPVAAPEPAPAAPEPVPVAEPEPAPAAEAPPGLDVRGLWLGTADGRSMKLTITKQSGDSFSGSAQVELDGGTWMSIPLSGTVNADGGAISFRGTNSAASFSGKASGMRASGTYTLEAGHVPMKWSVVR